jgi:hypothetical protein
MDLQVDLSKPIAAGLFYMNPNFHGHSYFIQCDIGLLLKGPKKCDFCSFGNTNLEQEAVRLRSDSFKQAEAGLCRLCKWAVKLNLDNLEQVAAGPYKLGIQTVAAVRLNIGGVVQTSANMIKVDRVQCWTIKINKVPSAPTNKFLKK